MIGEGVRVSVGVGDFYPYHRVHTSSGAHPASYPVGTMCSFPGSKAAGAWSYTSTPQYAFMAWCSVWKKHRDNFTCSFTTDPTARFCIEITNLYHLSSFFFWRFRNTNQGLGILTVVFFF